MEATTSEQQGNDAETTAKGGPLTQPLPLAGERSAEERSGSSVSVNVAARQEESLLGAKPASEKPTVESAEPPEQAKSQQPAAEQPAKPTYGEFKLPEGVAVDAESLKPAGELFAE